MATMSDADRDKWDTRYRTGDYVPHWKPSPFLVDSLAVIPPGRALDVVNRPGFDGDPVIV